MAGLRLLVLCTSPSISNQGNKGGSQGHHKYPYTRSHQGVVGFLTEAAGWREQRLLTGQEETVHAGTRRLEQLVITQTALKISHHPCFSSTLARDATSLLVPSTSTRKLVGIPKTLRPQSFRPRTASATAPTYELPRLPAKPASGEQRHSQPGPDYDGADREDLIGREDIARGGIAPACACILAWCIS